MNNCVTESGIVLQKDRPHGRGPSGECEYNAGRVGSTIMTPRFLGCFRYGLPLWRRAVHTRCYYSAKAIEHGLRLRQEWSALALHTSYRFPGLYRTTPRFEDSWRRARQAMETGEFSATSNCS